MEKDDDHHSESRSVPISSDPGSGDIIRRFFEKHRSGRCALIPYAPAVVLIARIDGAQRCADFFSELTGHSFSRKPVTDIVNKVERGDIVVTKEQLTHAAKSHPHAAQFAEACPWVIDPKGRKSATEDTRKNTKKNPAKKGGTSSTPPTVTDDEPTSVPSPPRGESLASPDGQAEVETYGNQPSPATLERIAEAMKEAEKSAPLLVNKEAVRQLKQEVRDCRNRQRAI